MKIAYLGVVKFEGFPTFARMSLAVVGEHGLLLVGHASSFSVVLGLVLLLKIQSGGRQRESFFVCEVEKKQ